MEDLEFKGRVEQIGKSLYFTITETRSGKEQSYPLVEVRPNASPCLMFGKWDLALSGGGITEDLEIINVKEVELQIQNLKDRIHEHLSEECDCSETIETKHFRTLGARMDGKKVIMTIGLYENSVDQLVHHDFIIFDSAMDFYKGIISILEWGTQHRSFDRHHLLLLNEIEHSGYDVVAAIGTLYEDWIYNKGHEIKDEVLRQRIESLLNRALDFQQVLE